MMTIGKKKQLNSNNCLKVNRELIWHFRITGSKLISMALYCRFKRKMEDKTGEQKETKSVM